MKAFYKTIPLLFLSSLVSAVDPSLEANQKAFVDAHVFGDVIPPTNFSYILHLTYTVAGGDHNIDTYSGMNLTKPGTYSNLSLDLRQRLIKKHRHFWSPNLSTQAPSSWHRHRCQSETRHFRGETSYFWSAPWISDTMQCDDSWILMRLLLRIINGHMSFISCKEEFIWFKVEEERRIHSCFWIVLLLFSSKPYAL
jgi:hypothetical protein